MTLHGIAKRCVFVAVPCIVLATAVHAQAPPVQVVLFTHIEDNTPTGTLGSVQNRQSYLTWRGGSSFPNPFTAMTTIGFTVGRATHVRVAIYDVLGRQVATLVDGARQPGRYIASWPAAGAATGVYFCRLQTQDGGAVQGRKLLLIR